MKVLGCTSFELQCGTNIRGRHSARYLRSSAREEGQAGPLHLLVVMKMFEKLLLGATRTRRTDESEKDLEEGIRAATGNWCQKIMESQIYSDSICHTDRKRPSSTGHKRTSVQTHAHGGLGSNVMCFPSEGCALGSHLSLGASKLLVYRLTSLFWSCGRKVIAEQNIYSTTKEPLLFPRLGYRYAGVIEGAEVEADHLARELPVCLLVLERHQEPPVPRGETTREPTKIRVDLGQVQHLHGVYEIQTIGLKFLSWWEWE